MEDNSVLDIKAIELVIKDTMREAIIGIVGIEETDEMLYKMHTAIDMATKLRIKDLDLTITLKQLVKAKKEYEKQNEVDDIDE